MLEGFNRRKLRKPVNYFQWQMFILINKKFSAFFSRNLMLPLEYESRKLLEIIKKEGLG